MVDLESCLKDSTLFNISTSQRGKTVVTVDYLRLWDNEPDLAKSLSKDFNNTKRNIQKVLAKIKNKKMPNVQFKFKNFPDFKVDLTSSAIYKRAMKNKSGQLVRFSQFVFLDMGRAEPYKFLEQYAKDCECDEKPNKFKIYSLNELLREVSDLKAKDGFAYPVKCKFCKKFYSLVQDKTMYKNYQKAEVMLMMSEARDPEIKCDIFSTFLENDDVDRFTVGSICQGVLAFDLLARFSRKHSKFIGDIKPYLLAVDISPFNVESYKDSYFGLLKGLKDEFLYYSRIRKEKEAENNKIIEENKSASKKIELDTLAAFEDAFVNFYSICDFLSKKFDCKDFKLIYLLILQMIAFTDDFKSGSKSKLLDINYSSKIANCTNSLIYCDDINFRVKQIGRLLGSFGTSLIVICPKFDEPDLLVLFLIKHSHRILIIKNIHTWNSKVKSILISCIRSNEVEYKDNKLRVKVSFLFLVDSTAVKMSNKTAMRNRNALCFKSMNLIIDEVILNSILISFDNTQSNNEITYRNEIDMDLYNINSMIEHLTHEMPTKKTKRISVQNMDRLSVFSEFSQVFSTVRLKKSSKTRDNVLTKSEELLLLKPDIVNNFFYGIKNLMNCSKEFAFRFELLLKAVSCLLTFFTKDIKEENYYSLFEFFISVFWFEENNLLLYGAEANLFGNDFSVLTFYIRNCLEKGDGDKEDFRLMNEYASELFENLVSEFKSDN